MNRTAREAALMWLRHAMQQPAYRDNPVRLAHGVATIYTIVRARSSLYSRIRHWWQQLRRRAPTGTPPKSAEQQAEGRSGPVTWSYGNEPIGGRHGDRT
jgi:hypothetical protein